MNEWSSGKGVGVICEIELDQYLLKTVGNFLLRMKLKIGQSQ